MRCDAALGHRRGERGMVTFVLVGVGFGEVRVDGRALREIDVRSGQKLPVAQLADVVLALDTVDAGRTLPAEEDVAGGLHQVLAGNHAMPLVVVLAAAAMVGQHRRLRVLGLQEQRLLTAPWPHSKGPGSVSSKSLTSNTSRRSGEVNAPKFDRCASPQS